MAPKTNASLIFYKGGEASRVLDSAAFGDLIGLNTTTSIFSNPSIGSIRYRDYFDLISDGPANYSFELTTTYPGLIIGSGYSHPAIDQNDFQMGFCFDHTTGIPVLPGSSVKGTIKSVFPKQSRYSSDNQATVDAKLRYVNGLLAENLGINQPAIVLTDDKANPFYWGGVFSKSDAFFDAYISAVRDYVTTEQNPIMNRILADDYVTPHHQDPIGDPTPLRFIKIAAGVTFTFQFRLTDSGFGDQTLSAEQKARLFETILRDTGIGAKRNVGYGCLI